MADELKNNAELAVNLTIAWLNNPNVRANRKKATEFQKSVHATLKGFDAGGETETESAAAEASSKVPAKISEPALAPSETPKVSVRRSLASPDHIISMIDGKPYKTLKRHLSSRGMSPAQYRERFGLKPDYPMVAPSYSERRRETAKKIGLGRKPEPKRGRGKKTAVK